MRKLTLTILTNLFCLSSNVVWSADFKKGLAAYIGGDCVIILGESVHRKYQVC